MCKRDINEWEYSPEPKGSVQFDWRGSFDEQVMSLQSKNKGTFKRGSHNYYVLRALFYGNTVDDYGQKVKFPNGLTINNIRTRISDLRNNWNISIGDRQSPHGRYKEYKIHGRNI